MTLSGFFPQQLTLPSGKFFMLFGCLLTFFKISFLKKCFREYSKNLCKMATQKDQKIVFNTIYRLMQVKSIAECRSILQYFRPSLSYHLSLRSLFCLFLSGCFTQVLLYFQSVRQFGYRLGPTIKNYQQTTLRGKE